MSKGKKLLRIAGGALVIAVLAWFAYANAGRYVDLRFGLFPLRSVSLPVVIYGSVMASFGVERFSLDRFRDLTQDEVEQRFEEFRALTRF